MKSLLVTSFRGGTGRAMLSRQLAHYPRLASVYRLFVRVLAEIRSNAMSAAYPPCISTMTRGPLNVASNRIFDMAAAHIDALAVFMNWAKRCCSSAATRRVRRHAAWQPGMRKTIWRRMAPLAAVLVLSLNGPSTALADDWGCQVMLCLSNPGGPEQYGECVPPIEKLWRALRHGDPFPSCDFGEGQAQGTSATNTFASAGYCREDLLVWGGPEQSELLCRTTGAINVEIDHRLYTRVWWGIGGRWPTVTEFYGAGSTQVPYDPAQSATLFLKRNEQQEDRFGGGN
ncbi:hypothetical protein [Burkholderia sp. NFACC33-1]|uniref:Uncharacterized protein n=1 Tax=Burkholderia pyrrocinia TaxID=60550 RepID=A0A318I1W1_BURPY|nr:hypothetical protein NA66_103618 [Burkholderia pyrrocinia]SFW88732.1 hypothetical protein SAMN03159384_06678 [Burkholderia sp. NFACC33-1]SFY46170.1 hypothetical protein SAMN03159408_06705 [Burkholderia sp. NFPP32]